MGTSGFFLQISHAWNGKINQDKQRDRPSSVGDHRHTKVKPYEEQQLKLKNHLLRRKYYILKKVLHFKISAIKENTISNRKFYLSKRKFCN